MKTKIATMGVLGAGMLALPFAMPSTAQADDFKISLNLGGTPYYQSYSPPVVRHVVYREAPRRVVYVNKPVYRERIVYRDWRGPKHWKKDNHGHGRWDDRGHRVAWR